MHGQLPPKDMEQLFRAKEIPHDIYIVATQECQRTIASSMFAPGKEKWDLQLQSYLGPDYIMVRSYAL